MKKVLIQNDEQLELVQEEIRVSSLFVHPNLLPLIDHAIIKVKVTVSILQRFTVHFTGLEEDLYDQVIQCSDIGESKESCMAKTSFCKLQISPSMLFYSNFYIKLSVLRIGGLKD